MNLEEEIIQLVKTNPRYATIEGVIECSIIVTKNRIDSLYFKPIENINEFQWNHVLDRVKELFDR